MILAGDIGGTKANLALFQERDGSLELAEIGEFRVADYPDFAATLREFLAGRSIAIDRASFGAAGPVINERCQVTNHPWEICVEDLKKRLGISKVFLLNDLAALACVVPFLKPDQTLTLQQGRPHSKGPIGVIAAGTGLGQAFLVPGESEKFRVLSSEGGQADFSPHCKMSAQLLLHLLEKEERVKAEEIVSGPGLLAIYEFVKLYNSASEPEWLTQEFKRQDPPAVIVQYGLNKKSALCGQALELFVSIYGAAAGNLALQINTRGGIYIGGGIAPRLASLMGEEVFLDSFLSKGTFRSFLESVPVHMILDDKAALWGAARYSPDTFLVER